MILFPWFQAEIWVTMVSASPSCYAGKSSVTWARSWRLKSSKRLSWSNKISHCREGLLFRQLVPEGETQVLPVVCWKVLSSNAGKSEFPLDRGTCKSQITKSLFVQLGLTSRHQRYAPLSKSSGHCILSLQQKCGVPIPNGMWIEDTNSVFSPQTCYCCPLSF